MTGGRAASPGPLVLDHPVLSEVAFRTIRTLLHRHAGIALAPYKLTMVQSRLSKRLRALGIQSFEDYLAQLKEDRSGEWPQFVNALTTNLTKFFRESHHFTCLAELLKPFYEESRRIRIWSAGCSTGEEPYSLAMTLLKAFGPEAPIQILATDLDTAALETASRGVYPVSRLEGMPEEWKRLAFLKGAGRFQGLVRIRPEVRRMVTFQQMNLVEPSWRLERGVTQAIFCRNVMIYFDKATQREILRNFHRLLEPRGLLFLGHSEAVLDATLGFQSIGQTLYRRKEGGS